MKKLLLILISIFLLESTLYCQEKKLVIKESQKIVNSTNINPLLVYQGNITGNYKGFFFADKPETMQVNYAKRNFNIPNPLHDGLYSGGRSIRNRQWWGVPSQRE